MSSARLTARTPSACVVGPGRLPGHALRWHKLGRDGSGKCDVIVVDTGSTAVVWGVLYRIDCAEKADLDRIEGLGVGYDEHEVVVATEAGEVAARTYRARDRVPWIRRCVRGGGTRPTFSLARANTACPRRTLR